MESKQSEQNLPDPSQPWCESCEDHSEYQSFRRTGVDEHGHHTSYSVAKCLECGGMMRVPSLMRTKWRVFKYFAAPMSVLVPSAAIFYLWDSFVDSYPMMLWMLALAIPINLVILYGWARRYKSALREFDAKPTIETAYKDGRKLKERTLKDGKEISVKYWNSKGEEVETLEESKK